MENLGLQEFILEGSYKQLKLMEEKLRLLRDSIREEQRGLNKKRMVWKDVGVIGEFIYVKQYNYYLELNVLLYDLGILPEVALLDTTQLTVSQIIKLQPSQIPGKKYVRYTPNKNGRVDSNEVFVDNVQIDEMCLMEKVTLWKQTHLKYRELARKWGVEKRRAINSVAFNLTNKIQFESGSIILLQNPASYDTKKAYRLMNAETFIKCAKVNQDKLAEFAARGFFNKSDLNRFREISEIQEKYTLITFQNENNRRNYWNSRLERLSLLSQGFS